MPWVRKLSAEELEAKIDEVIDYCDAHQEPPVSFILRKIAGISDDTINRYRKAADGESEDGSDEGGDEAAVTRRETDRRYAAAIKKWDEYRTAFWIRWGMANPKAQGFAAFQLKQPANGGYKDRQDIGGAVEATVTIKTDGVGADAFK